MFGMKLDDGRHSRSNVRIIQHGHSQLSGQRRQQRLFGNQTQAHQNRTQTLTRHGRLTRQRHFQPLRLNRPFFQQ